MQKIHTTVSIDANVLKKAQEMGFNISGECEEALRKRETSTNTDIPKADGIKCEFCNLEFPKQTADDVRNGTCRNTLVWLCPDEVWCCESCLRTRQARIVRVGVAL